MSAFTSVIILILTDYVICHELGICIDNSGGSTIVKWVKDIVKIYQDRK